MAELLRIETWTDVQCNDGIRTGFVPREALAGPVIDDRVLSESETFDLPLVAAHRSAAKVVGDGVIRAVFGEADDPVTGARAFDEWRVGKLYHARRKDGALITRARCDSIKFDLKHRAPLLEWLQANGEVWLHEEYKGLTPDALIDVIFANPAMPPYFAKGTVAVSATDISQAIHYETPGSALDELARIAEAELNVRRNGTTNYLIDIEDEIHATRDPVWVSYGADELDAARTDDVVSIGTLIYPRGAGPVGFEADISRVRWELGIATAPGYDWKLISMRTAEVDQLTYAHPVAGPLNVLVPEVLTGVDAGVITGSTPVGADTDITVQSPGSFAVGQIAEIVLGGTISFPAVRRLTYVPLPSGIVEWGERPLTLDRNDIQGVDNLLPDPYMREWVGNDPVHYAPSLTGITVTKVTDRAFAKSGPFAAKCVATLPSANISVGQFDVEAWLTADRPNLSFQVLVYVETGTVEFWILAQPEQIVMPDAEHALFSSREHAWYLLSIEPGAYNFHKAGTKRVSLVVDAEFGPATFYVSEWAIVPNAFGGPQIWEGHSSRRLWNAAIAHYEAGAAHPKVTYDLGLIDSERLGIRESGRADPGVPVRMFDPGLSETVHVDRIYRLQRRLTVGGWTKAEIVG